MSKRPLTDAEISDMLGEMWGKLIHAKGATSYGENTLRTTERAVGMIHWAMTSNIVKGED